MSPDTAQCPLRSKPALNWAPCSNLKVNCSVETGSGFANLRIFVLANVQPCVTLRWSWDHFWYPEPKQYGKGGDLQGHLKCRKGRETLKAGEKESQLSVPKLMTAPSTITSCLHSEQHEREKASLQKEMEGWALGKILTGNYSSKEDVRALLGLYKQNKPPLTAVLIPRNSPYRPISFLVSSAQKLTAAGFAEWLIQKSSGEPRGYLLVPCLGQFKDKLALPKYRRPSNNFFKREKIFTDRF